MPNIKLKDYISQLQAIAEEHPNVTVITAKDEEGNGYSPVFYAPTLGYFDKALQDFDTDSTRKHNAVCVN